MLVREIWRYPVKSMGGERLEQALVTALGIEGDRVVHVRDARGRTVTSRSRPKLLGHHAILGEDGEPLVDGRPWTDPTVAADVRAAAGDDTAELVRWDGPERFDVLPLLVATDGALDAFGYDYRRLRPNVVIAGVEGQAEREWEGSILEAGDVRIGIQDLRQRCIMTTFDPDTQVQDVEVLRKIHREFGGSLALNCSVLKGGVLRVGDPVRLID